MKTVWYQVEDFDRMSFECFSGVDAESLFKMAAMDFMSRTAVDYETSDYNWHIELFDSENTTEPFKVANVFAEVEVDFHVDVDLDAEYEDHQTERP